MFRMVVRGRRIDRHAAYRIDLGRAMVMAGMIDGRGHRKAGAGFIGSPSRPVDAGSEPLK